MNKTTRNASSSKALEHPLPMPVPPLSGAYQDLRVSVDRFCLLAGIEAIGEMLVADAEAVCGPRHARGPEGRGHRWGTTTSELTFQEARVKLERPRVREPGGGELSLPSFELLSDPEMRGASDAGRGRWPAVVGGGREFQVGGLAPLRGADVVEVEGLAGEPAGRTGSSGNADGRASCRRSRDGGGERHRCGRRETRAGPGRGREGEQGHGAGPARQPDRARSRFRAPPALHRRRRQGALQGDPAELRARGPYPALPGAQGTQHHRPAGRRAWCRASARPCAKPGIRETRPRPSGSCAISPAAWNWTLPGSPRPSWRASTRSSPSSASACRRNAAAHWPAQTPSRMRWARSGPCNATSNDGATPRWRYAGPPLASWRRRRPSAASRPTGNSPSSTPPCETPSRRQKERELYTVVPK